MKASIAAGLNRYSLRVSGSIPLVEFKNRVLRDVAYILGKLNKTRSYQATFAHIANVLPPRMQRKQRMCVMVLQNVLLGATDAELTERAILYCRTLLAYGSAEFERELDTLVPGVECYWAKVPVREKRRYAVYDFVGKRCSRTKGLCRIGEALKARERQCRELLEFLEGLPSDRMTPELDRSREFLRTIIDRDFRDVEAEDPCLKVGDLLIALESANVQDFYTMNYRESQAFCDFFGQTVAVRPNDPAQQDREYGPADRPWPKL